MSLEQNSRRRKIGHCAQNLSDQNARHGIRKLIIPLDRKRQNSSAPYARPPFRRSTAALQPIRIRSRSSVLLTPPAEKTELQTWANTCTPTYLRKSSRRFSAIPRENTTGTDRQTIRASVR